MEWYEQLKKQCKKCSEYLAMELMKETYKYYHWKCKFCGFKKRNEVVWGQYMKKDRMIFLKNNIWKGWKEVELLKTKSYWKVVPVKNLKINL